MTSKRQLIKITEGLPPKGIWVIAVTPYLRCIAYMDAEGKWRPVNRGGELRHVTGWLSLEPPP